MACDAAALGVDTDQTTGWVPYPIPSDVLLNTRMHLDVHQVEWLVEELQNWLNTGKLREE